MEAVLVGHVRLTCLRRLEPFGDYLIQQAGDASIRGARRFLEGSFDRRRHPPRVHFSLSGHALHGSAVRAMEQFISGQQYAASWRQVLRCGAQRWGSITRRNVMRRIVTRIPFVLLALPLWQSIAFAQQGAPPNIAFDIPKTDIDLVLKNAPPSPPDRQLRVVDMGKYNLGVGVIHRGPTNDKPGDPISMIYHDYTAETYIITSGSGVLTTGGIIVNKKASAGAANVMNGPSGNGTAGAGAYSRKVQAGDIIIIPTGVGHGWSQITDHVTYLSVRPDPDRVLPAGYVYPLLLKNQPTPVK
jgi:hypothetical protein